MNAENWGASEESQHKFDQLPKDQQDDIAGGQHAEANAINIRVGQHQDQINRDQATIGKLKTGGYETDSGTEQQVAVERALTAQKAIYEQLGMNDMVTKTDQQLEGIKGDVAERERRLVDLALENIIVAAGQCAANPDSRAVFTTRYDDNTVSRIADRLHVPVLTYDSSPTASNSHRFVKLSDMGDKVIGYSLSIHGEGAWVHAVEQDWYATKSVEGN